MHTITITDSPQTGQPVSQSATTGYTLIRGCSLLAPGPTHDIIPNQDILLYGQRILATGESGTLQFHGMQSPRVITGEGCLALPGLINAHTHSLENLLKATSPSLPLELWLIPLFAAALEWSPRLVYLSTLSGAIEMLKTGTTAVLDHLWTGAGVATPYLNATMQAYHDAGIRAAVAPSIEDQDLVLEEGKKRGFAFPVHPFTERFKLWPSIAEQLTALERFIVDWDHADNGRLRCFVGPSGIHWCSPTLLEDCLALAERYKTGMHLHAVETELQARIIQANHGQSGIHYLEQMQILRPGTSLAHTIWLDDGDLAILARTGTTVVHNPISNLRLGSGRFPLNEALQHGVIVALGSDGSASNDSQNMFAVLKLTGLLHNQPEIEYQHWPRPTEILLAATQGGATALGQAHELGTIAEGQLADIVLLNLAEDSFLPLHDPYLHLIYCEHGNAVDTVIVNGEVVVEHGKVSTVDEEALHQEIREHVEFAARQRAQRLTMTASTTEMIDKLTKLRHLVLRNGKHK